MLYICVVELDITAWNSGVDKRSQPQIDTLRMYYKIKKYVTFNKKQALITIEDFCKTLYL